MRVFHLQFNISNYEIKNRRDRDKNVGGLTEFVRKDFITKRPVCMALNTYDNIIVMGVFNIDINKDEGIDHDKLDVFCDTLNLTNLVKSETLRT